MPRIDHLVLAVRNLDHAAGVYRRLGFQVGARNRHPWGTENRLIQFGSSFLELITVGAAAELVPHQPRQFSFGAFVRDFLAQREGLVMLVLSSADARSDAARFAAQGIGDFEPFSFSRKGLRPDGSETQVAFTLAFARDAEAPDLSFFVCQQHYPENFWNPEFQQHTNTATDIARVTLAAGEPQRHQGFLAAFSGALPQPQPNGGATFRLQQGEIQLVRSSEQAPHGSSPRFASFTVGVEDLDAARRVLTRAAVDFTSAGAELVLSPALLHGVEVRFAGAGESSEQGAVR